VPACLLSLLGDMYLVHTVHKRLTGLLASFSLIPFSQTAIQ